MSRNGDPPPVRCASPTAPRRCAASTTAPAGRPHADALARFHPLIRTWFEDECGTPTDIQARSWPRIAAGEHLLATAPTGSGKTLAAFLWAINAFATGAWQPGATRVLYVSPLKALGTDIRANLLAPIAALSARFEAAGEAFPALRAQTRTGDTGASERQRLLRRPPELLITTPESLNLMLTSARGRHALASVETVVLDEIHALMENRRGVQLMVGVERLVELAGEVQRVALSATVRPLPAVAAYVGGRDAGGRPRPVAIAASPGAKRIALEVRFPEAAGAAAQNGEPIWTPLAAVFRERIAANAATLLFTNSRRLAEKIALNVNAGAPEPIAYAHHGSLGREVRTEVETRLKAGRLKAIVATASLEMGIDIGALEEVVLVQTPPSVASALQRIGRAGHRVGAVSRAILFPTFAQDFVEAAAIAAAVRERDIEPLRAPANPLDVLAQTLVSCAGTAQWETDALYRMIRRAQPYADLPREQFDLVVEMLAGRYAGTRLRELRPRLAFDRVRQTVKARQGALLALYAGGGTIVDRGHFALRHADTGALIGELDEEFVWEAAIGQTFSLGSQAWRVFRITANAVLVREAPPKAAAPPFWRAETRQRSSHFARRVGAFLELANDLLASGRADDLRRDLKARGFDSGATAALVDHLVRQRAATGRLPHANHLLVEHVLSGPGGYEGPDNELVLHTLAGGQVNHPLALALRAAWRERFGTAADVHADNNAIAVRVRPPVDAAAVLGLVTPANLEGLLRRTLEDSSFFGARFRECAGRALLITKRRIGQRTPLWMTRLQAKKLLAATKPLPDFPILAETWRTCLRDEFDLPATLALLERLASGALPWSLAKTAVPSPFAADIAFNQIGGYMYADDAPGEHDRGPSALSDDLIAQVAFDASLRPAIRPEVIADLESKLQRTHPDYRPDGEEALAEWVKERVAVPAGEWFDGVARPNAVRRLRRRGRGYLVHDEIALGDDPLRQAAQMLQFYGPRTAPALAELLPFADVEGVLAALLEEGALVAGPLVAGDAARHYCDAENLQTLIRFQRAASRPRLASRPVADLAPFLVRWHGFGSDQAPAAALDRLRGYVAGVDYWLDEALPPRSGAPAQGLESAWDAGLAWRGAGKESATVGFAEDFDVLAPPRGDGLPAALARLFVDPAARYTFAQLRDAWEGDADDCNAAIWQAVWQGWVAADGFRALAMGRDRRYRLHEGGASGLGPTQRPSRIRARGVALGWPGTWYTVPPPQTVVDAVERLEAGKERCRALLDRYGVLCRELAGREGALYRWSALFPALRLMELAGEVVSGLFFDGLSGPQFAVPEAVRELQRFSRAGATFWVSALDPVAPCGLGLGEMSPRLPQRRLGNHLGWFEGALAVVSERYGKRLAIGLPPDDPGVDALLPHLAALCRARGRLTPETVNGEPLRASPHLPALARHMRAVTDHKGVYFEPL